MQEGGNCNATAVLAEERAYLSPPAVTAYRRIKPLLPDQLVTTLSYARTFGKLRLFVRPRSFNERLLYKKLRDRDPRLVRTTDKFLVRDYVAQRIGAEYLIPLLLVTDDPRRIDFAALPRAFVVKATHGSGWVLVVPDKDKTDPEEIIAMTSRWLKSSYYDLNREWATKDVVPRLVIEELLVDDRGEVPIDFKLFVFKGRARLIEVESGRFVDYRENYFDTAWRELDVRTTYQRREESIPWPPQLEEMITVAERLAGDFEVARIDLYSHAGRIFFGEITHYPGQGMYRWKPRSFDAALGRVWENGDAIPEEYYIDRRA